MLIGKQDMVKISFFICEFRRTSAGEGSFGFATYCESIPRIDTAQDLRRSPFFGGPLRNELVSLNP